MGGKYELKKGDENMFNEAEGKMVEVEISSSMLEELIRRANSMEFTVGEYAGCVVGQHMDSNEALEG